MHNKFITKKVKSFKRKEKDICKEFYHKVRTLQLYNAFGFHFFIFHVANEQNTSKNYTIELKRMGLRAGVADYCVLLPDGRVAFIEFKRDEASARKKNENQIAFHDECKLLQIPYLLTWDAEVAIDWIKALVAPLRKQL
jgi:hypothetical protein